MYQTHQTNIPKHFVLDKTATYTQIFFGAHLSDMFEQMVDLAAQVAKNASHCVYPRYISRPSSTGGLLT